MFYSLVRNTFLLIFKLFFNLKVFGKENIPKSGGFILASNHLSNFDPPLMAAAYPRPLNFMAKEELFRNYLFGKILSNLHAFPVKRGGSDMVAIRKAIKILNAGQGLLIFPQGTRKNSFESDNLKRGISFLAKKTGVQIIPAKIFGTDTALASGSRKVKLCKIRVVFGRPMNIDKDITDDDLLIKISLEIDKLSLTKEAI